MARPFRLGGYRVDPRTGEVSGPGGTARLPPKAMSVLALLAEHAPEPVAKRELLDATWDHPVGDEVLTNAVWQLRRAFGDTSRPAALIRTHPRRGYQLLALPVPDEPDALPSIAVLPLENLTGDPEQEYLVDGLSEALTNRLARHTRLRVLAWASVKRYKLTPPPSLRELGQALGVDYAVTGSVRRAGRRISVDAQLVECRTQLHRWAAGYERDLGDALALQDELTDAIAAGIDSRLTPSGGRSGPVDPHAYDAYLRGRFLLERPTIAEVEQGLARLAEAIRCDPDFAPAYAARASGYFRLASWGQAPGRELIPRVESCAREALERDPTLVEARARAVLASRFGCWDPAAAERELRELLAADPTAAAVVDGLARCLAARGRFDEAVALEDELLARDPLSATALTARASFRRLQGRYGEAIAGLRTALALHAHWLIARLELARALRLAGRGIEAVAELRRAMPEWADCLERALRGDASAAPSPDVAAVEAGSYVAPYWAAERCMWAGREEWALRWLERAREDRQLHAVFAAVEPTFAPLRGMARFRRLTRPLRDREPEVDQP